MTTILTTPVAVTTRAALDHSTAALTRATTLERARFCDAARTGAGGSAPAEEFEPRTFGDEDDGDDANDDVDDSFDEFFWRKF